MIAPVDLDPARLGDPARLQYELRRALFEVELVIVASRERQDDEDYCPLSIEAPRNYFRPSEPTF